MAKFVKSFGFFGMAVVLIIGGSYYLFLFHKSQPHQTQNPQPAATEVITNPETTPELTLTLAPTPSVRPVTKTATPAPPGSPQGQIACNYQIPPGPAAYGTAAIVATWNNLTIGKSGSAQAAVCVAVNGQTPNLMSVDNSASGSRETSVSWLARNGSYTFSLYDDRGGDLANCTGTVLSSCRINTH